jgi:glucose-1-phosphate cytidylyltransferase
MKVAILAGGYGSRYYQETRRRPKPMIEVGGEPLLWHIFRHYAHFGFDEFVVAMGYKAEVIREYFAGHLPPASWRVELVDTGAETQTGGRIKRLAPALGGSTFMLTWGDGVADVDLRELLAFHRHHGRLATVTAVHPPSRFGHLEIAGDGHVSRFEEKPERGHDWINGAYFVLEPGALDYIEGDQSQWERGPMERLARDGELMAYRHEGFWQCMDTSADHRLLEELWRTGRAPWKLWNESEDG